MIIKELRDEDFVNYKKPSMFIAFPSCTFKCERECGKKMCQNSELVKAPDINIRVSDLVDRYLSNPITSAIVCGGLEPFDNFEDLWRLIFCLRVKGCNDDVVIYTGYYKNEILEEYLHRLMAVPNIIVKWGRFIPDQQPHFDKVLGIGLASDNQYAEVIS
jgi:hypothetical protein